MKLINSARFIAVLDANVLYPVVIRDYLLWLSIKELYSPKWTNQLMKEFMGIFEKREMNIPPERIQKQVQLMNLACPDALVNKYEDLIFSVKLTDEKDKHVVAAALKCNANVIVTHNLKDFPNNYLEKIGYLKISYVNLLKVSVFPDSFGYQKNLKQLSLFHYTCKKL